MNRLKIEIKSIFQEVGKYNLYLRKNLDKIIKRLKRSRKYQYSSLK